MKLALKIVIPLLFIALAALAFKLLVMSKKEKPSRSPQVVVPHADIISVEKQDHQPPVISYGTVQSYFETTLTPQVGGQIIEVSPDFRVGNLIKKGTVLARIDDTDYVAALARETSNLSTAKRTLAEEEIRAKQASEDWLASGRAIATASDFVLRKPQLAAARASIASTEAAVTKAEADIQRTIIQAPYDAVVLSRTASLGNYASQQQALGKLVATERVEIRLPLTAAQSARVDLKSLTNKSSAKAVNVIFTSATKPGVQWQGILARTEPSVDAKNQVTYVIAEVENPYTADPEPLAIGTFVNVTIPAKAIPGSFRMPESALVNDAFVWALDASDKLCQISAERVHSHEGDVFLRLSGKDMTDYKTKPPLRVVTRPLTNFKRGGKVKPVSVQSEESD